MSDQKMHLMSITPTQQAVLRIVLNALFRKQCEELISTSAIGGPTSVDTTLGRYDHLFQCYQACTAGLPSVTSVKYSRTKLIFLGPSAIRYMTEAVNRFNINDAGVDAEHTEVVSETITKLRALVNTSAEHSYSMEEVKQAGLA